jgi:hypothetical protein
MRSMELSYQTSVRPESCLGGDLKFKLALPAVQNYSSSDSVEDYRSRNLTQSIDVEP